MGASFRADLLTLAKRPAVRFLVVLPVILILFIRYALPYISYVQTKVGAPTPGAIPDQLASLLPSNAIRMVIDGLGVEGGGIALILGALAAGSEYDWGTLKTAFMVGPSRLAVYLGRALALGVVLVVLVLAVYAAALGAGLLITVLEGASVGWPSAYDAAKGIGDSWLILAMWSSFGVMLAVLLRGLALPIGLGLVWIFVVEGLLVEFANGVGALRIIDQAFPGANADALAVQFGDLRGNPVSGVPVSATHAEWVLAAYIVAFLALGAFLLRTRDVA